MTMREAVWYFIQAAIENYISGVRLWRSHLKNSLLNKLKGLRKRANSRRVWRKSKATLERLQKQVRSIGV